MTTWHRLVPVVATLLGCGGGNLAGHSQEGVAKDEARAKDLTARACREGHNPSCGGG